MRFWKFKIALILLVLGGVGFAQETTLKLKKSVSVKAGFIETDNIGNIYTVSGGEISMYSASGDFIMKNSALAFGPITSLDASNALKMVLYFKDLSQVSYLDNQLSARGDRVELDVLGYYQTTAICRSYNDGLWVYDQTTFELTRLTEQLEISAQSGSLAQVLGYVPSPNYMREFNNWLYVNDVEQGVLVFDWYGSYTKTIPIKGLKKFAVRAGNLFFISEGYLESYNLKTATFAKVKLTTTGIMDFSIFDDNLVIITENQLMIYGLGVE